MAANKKEKYEKFSVEVISQNRDEVRMSNLESVPDDGYGNLKFNPQTGEVEFSNEKR